MVGTPNFGVEVGVARRLEVDCDDLFRCFLEDVVDSAPALLEESVDTRGEELDDRCVYVGGRGKGLIITIMEKLVVRSYFKTNWICSPC